MYFDHLEPEDSSNYTCVASNSGGTSREIGMVIVECKWILSLEKVLLDPIFILKWINFDSLWIVFWNSSWRFGFSTRSVGHVMFSLVGTAQEAVAVYIKKKPHQWTANKDTNCPRSITSSCFLGSSHKRKHHSRVQDYEMWSRNGVNRFKIWSKVNINSLENYHFLAILGVLQS